MIWITGLPRTGSTSVAEAMSILGYDVYHFCPITNNSNDLEVEEIKKQYNCAVSSKLLFNLNLDGDWIFLDREYSSWKISMNNIGEDLSNWQSHLDIWQNIKNNNSNFLYSAKSGWKDLCNHLDIQEPKVKFPHINKSFNYRTSDV